MANNFSVVVLTPNGRRNTVKCNSNTTILQILEQTCTKHEFRPEEYDLTHHNHVLDVSTTLRFSGLPNNAFLEMAEAKKTRKETEVVIGLQLESGERIMGNFTPSTDLLSILTSLVPSQCAPELNPVVIYMRREVYGEASLRETTLKSLGLTGGRAILRLIHRTPEQLKVQANVSAPIVAKPKDDTEISFNTSSILSSTKVTNEQAGNSSDKQKTEVVDSSKNTALSATSEGVLNETFMSIPNSSSVSAKEDEKMDTAELTNTPKEETNSRMDTESIPISDSAIEEKQDDSHLDEEIIVLGERNALVFSQNMSSRLPYDDMPDDFYDLSVNEVRKLFTDLGRKREELDNTPLQTEALKNLEVNRRVITQLHDYRKVVLRILFPDRIVLQGTFGPLDTIDTVMKFVKDYLQNPAVPFDLYVAPPKSILKKDTTLIDSNCVPSALIHFGPLLEESDTQELSKMQYLKDEILSKLTSPEAASHSASKTRGIKNVPESTSSDSRNVQTGSETISSKKPTRSQPFSVPGPSKSKDGKVPKWFKTSN